MPRIDAHLHVFTKASAEFPREISDVWPAEREEPVEKLLGEMEKHQIDQAVLVQMAGCEYRKPSLPTTMPQRISKPIFRDWIGAREDIRTLLKHMAELTDNTGIIGFRFSTFGGPR